MFAAMCVCFTRFKLATVAMPVDVLGMYAESILIATHSFV